MNTAITAAAQSETARPAYSMTTSALSSILAIDLTPETTTLPPSTLTALNRQLDFTARNIRPWDRRHDGAPRRLSRMVTAAAPSPGYLYSQETIDAAELEALFKNTAGDDCRWRLSVACRLDDDAPSQRGAAPECKAIAEIRWRPAGALPPLAFFKRFSDAGIWNHVILADRFAPNTSIESIARHPNIVHSWETTGDDYEQGAYGTVRPLPGRPLWQVVKDPVKRFVLVVRLGKEQLLRLRIGADGDRIHTVGQHLEFAFLPPDKLPPGYLDDICTMVAAGGTVATTHVRSNLERAYLIGVATEKGVIVGNSSLKNPRPAYIESVHRRSGLDLTGFVERGYTSVRPEYRGLGIGTRLLEGLTRRAGDRRIFSVISEDNEATQIIARRNRTRRVAAYYSPTAGKQVGIWMPEGTVAPRTEKARS